MNCKGCDKSFHHCTSCGFIDHCIDAGYCSNKCWHGSAEYKLDRTIFRRFMYSLDVEQHELYDKILMFSENLVDVWYEEIKKEKE